MHVLARAAFADLRIRAMPKTTGPDAGPAFQSDQTPCNCLALRQAARHLSQAYDRHLSQTGLRSSQYSILSKLSRLGPMPIGKLADTMVMERTALGRALGPLERDRLVAVGCLLYTSDAADE